MALNWLDIITNQATGGEPRWINGNDAQDGYWERDPAMYWTSPEGKKYTITENPGYDPTGTLYAPGHNPRWIVTTDTDAMGNWQTKGGDPRDFVHQGISATGQLEGDPTFARKNTSFVNFRDDVAKTIAKFAAMAFAPYAMGELGLLGNAAGEGLATGAFLGEGIASGIPAWDAAMGAAVPGMATGGAAAIPDVNPTDLRLAAGTQTAPYGTPYNITPTGLTQTAFIDLPNPGSVPTTTTPPTPPKAPTESWKIPGTDISLTDVAKVVAPVAGAIVGSKKPDDETTQKKIDPRLDPYIYGQNGLLDSASRWYQGNSSGVNPTMQQGWNMQKGLLTNPQIQQQLAGLLGGSYGMASGPVAGNPFLRRG